MYFLIKNRIPILGIFIILAGCVSLPKDEQTQNLLSPPSIDTSVANSLDTRFFSVGDWPEETWWTIFHSGQLDHLIAKGTGAKPLHPRN